MERTFCEDCGRFTSFRRHFGIGTLIGCIFTFGLWILLMPFYDTECKICGLSERAVRADKMRSERAKNRSSLSTGSAQKDMDSEIDRLAAEHKRQRGTS